MLGWYHSPRMAIAIAVAIVWAHATTAPITRANARDDRTADEVNAGSEERVGDTLRLSIGSGLGIDGSAAAGAASLDGRVEVDASVAHLTIAATAVERGTSSWTRLRGHADLLFLFVHEARLRYEQGQREVLAMGGLGFRSGDERLDIGVSLGGMYFHDTSSTWLFQAAAGAYLGGHLRIRIGRVASELRAAGFVALAAEPPALEALRDRPMASMAPRVSNGLLLTEHLYYEAHRSGPFSLGPELAMSYEQLPDGGEDVQVGLGFRAGAGM